MIRLLKIKNISITDSYLGAPLFVDRSKIKTFDKIVTNMENKAQSWNGTTLVQGK